MGDPTVGIDLGGIQIRPALASVDGTTIALGLANLIHIVEPELVLIGGGVAHIGELLFGTIRDTVRERAICCMARHLRIEPAALGDDAGVLGAIALFLEYGRG